MDLYSKYKAISDTLRNQVCELELVTRLTLDDASTQELTHVRRAVCKKAVRQKNKTILTFADIDRAALDRVFPFETFTTADFPELYVDHVGWRVPQGVGDVVKVPLAWIKKTGGTWKYAGPKVLGTAVVNAVYRGTREGQGSVVDPAEYTVTTEIGGSTGVAVRTINFTREQIDFQGRPYILEADFTLDHASLIGGASPRTPAAEIARVLTAFGISFDAASFGTVAAADHAIGFLLDPLYGSRDKGRTGNAIIEDLLAAGRSWLSQSTTIAWAIIQDAAKASTWQFDAAADDVSIEEYGDGEITKTVSLSYRPRASGLEDYTGLLTRNTTGQSGELKLSNPYIRSHVVGDRLLSYWQKRLNTLRLAEGYVHGLHLANGEAIDVTDQLTWGGTKKFIGTQITRPADRNSLKLREYDAEVYNYTAGTLPADATSGYSPDYSYTLPAAPTGLVVVSQGTAVDPDGKLTAYALIRATPPAVNWSRVMIQVRDTNTNEIYQAQLIYNAGNYEAVVSGLRPGRTHDVRAWAVNANNIDGTVTAAVNFTSANSANAPAAATLSSQQNSPRQVFLTWTAAAPGAGSTPIREYKIQRKVGAGSFADYNRSSSLDFIDDNVAIGTAYQYKIQAIDLVGNVGSDSNTSTITPVALIADFLITSQGVSGPSIANSSINQGRTLSAAQSQSGNILAGSVVSVGSGAGTDYSFAPGLTVGNAGSALGTLAFLLTPSSTQFVYYLKNNDAATQPYDADWRQVSA